MSGQLQYQYVLGHIGVLKLVYQYVAVPLLILLENVRSFIKQGRDRHDQVVKIKGIIGL